MVSPTYRFDAVFRGLWQSVLVFLPYIVGVIAVIFLAAQLIHWATRKRDRARLGAQVTVSATHWGQIILGMLRAASAVYAPLAFALLRRQATPGDHGAREEHDVIDALGSFPTGVCLVTVRDERGGPHGIVVTSLCVYSVDPPVVLLCVARDQHRHDLLFSSRPFGVHLLDRDQQLVAHRWEQDDDNRFSDADWRWERGVPVLQGVIAYLRCRPATLKRYGHHAVVIAHVDEFVTATNQRDPLLHLQGHRDWHISDGARLGSQG
jgi:flavin reductase ActVB